MYIRFRSQCWRKCWKACGIEASHALIFSVCSIVHFAKMQGLFCQFNFKSDIYLFYLYCQNFLIPDEVGDVYLFRAWEKRNRFFGLKEVEWPRFSTHSGNYKCTNSNCLFADKNYFLHQTMLHLLEEFLLLHKNNDYFFWWFLNRLSHSHPHNLGRADNDYFKFFKRHFDSGEVFRMLFIVQL